MARDQTIIHTNDAMRQAKLTKKMVGKFLMLLQATDRLAPAKGIRDWTARYQHIVMAMQMKHRIPPIVEPLIMKMRPKKKKSPIWNLVPTWIKFSPIEMASFTYRREKTMPHKMQTTMPPITYTGTRRGGGGEELGDG
jgi:hypothetical protein